MDRAVIVGAFGEVTVPTTQARAKISKLVSVLEKKLTEETLKPSLADFIRLVQLERELKEDEPAKKIKVTWVEPQKKSSSAKSSTPHCHRRSASTTPPPDSKDSQDQSAPAKARRCVRKRSD